MDNTKLTEEEAELMLQYYWRFIQLLDLEDDIHVYASGIVFVDQIAQLLDEYLEGN